MPMSLSGRSFLVLLLLLVLPSCLRGMDLKKSASWEYSVGSVEQTVQDADTLRFARLPRFNRLHELVQGEIGFLWVRARFHLPDSMRRKDLALLLGRAAIADEVYLNGEKIGQSGRFPPHFFSDWNGTRHRHLEARQILPTDTLLIKLYVHHEGALLGEILLDESHLVSSEYRLREFFGKDLNLAISLLLFIIAFYHLLIFIQRPKDRYNAYYALLGFSCALYLTNFYATAIPGFLEMEPSYLVFQKVVFIAMTVSALALGKFVSSFLDRRDPEWLRYLYGLVLLVFIVLFLGAPDFRVFNQFRGAILYMFMVPAAYIAFLLVHGLIRRQKGALTILIGFAPLFVAIPFDLVVREALQIPGVYLTGFGVPAFILTILFILSIRFVHTANEEDRLNQELEIDVFVRTNQLKEANLRLEKTLDELKDVNRRLEGIAVTDSLTKAFNRRAFDLRFDEEYSRARRNKANLSVLMVDIDFFKKINDEHGHLCGDECLVAVAASIQTSLKRPADILARYGGEEFVVLLPETDLAGAGTIAETMRSIVEALRVPYEDDVVRLTISVGVASFMPGTPVEKDTMLACADAALYKAKAEGRNRVVFAE